MSAPSSIRPAPTRMTFPQPRPEVREVRPSVHGGIDLEELELFGITADGVLDFSANVNPYGPAPAVREAVASAPMDRYPDPETNLLGQTLAESLGVAPEQILPGNGASELIWLTALTFVRRGDKVLVLGPTYSEYARSASLLGASVLTVTASDEDRFVVDPDAVARAFQEHRPRLAFLCNPNNPTGTVLATDVIINWAARFPQTLFVVDEAYLPFASEPASAFKPGVRNVLVLRSMTKDFALPGLRLGFALGPRDVIGWLRRVQPPWSVNALAQAAGVSALQNLTYYRDALLAINRAKADLVLGVEALGFTPMTSAAPFFLVPVGDGRSFRLRLLRRGVLVRDCASFGLPHYVRIATRRPEENERLLAALQKETSHAR